LVAVSNRRKPPVPSGMPRKLASKDSKGLKGKGFPGSDTDARRGGRASESLRGLGLVRREGWFRRDMPQVYWA